MVDIDRKSEDVGSRSDINSRISIGFKKPQVNKFNNLALLEIILLGIIPLIRGVRSLTRAWLYKIVAAFLSFFL